MIDYVTLARLETLLYVADIQAIKDAVAELRRLRSAIAFAQSDLAVARVTIEAQAGADMERVRLRAEVEALRNERAARDLAVAEAVRKACLYLGGIPISGPDSAAIQAINLTAFIAGVKP